MQTFSIDKFKIAAAVNGNDKICYILYPFDILDSWIAESASRFGITIAVITGMDWDNDLTPWKAKGVPSGSADFKGLAPQFLSLLKERLVPEIEKELNVSSGVERTLTGVSLSGLFTLWQWMECDLFKNIISLSGSFWYEGFLDWIKGIDVPPKTGRAYFLLGNKEALSPVQQFRDVRVNTDEIVKYLAAKGIRDIFEIVPGNHYQYAIPRLNRSFAWMFGSSR